MTRGYMQPLGRSPPLRPLKYMFDQGKIMLPTIYSSPLSRSLPQFLCYHPTPLHVGEGLFPLPPLTISDLRTLQEVRRVLCHLAFLAIPFLRPAYLMSPPLLRSAVGDDVGQAFECHAVPFFVQTFLFTWYKS